MPDREPSFDTLAVHAGAEPDELTGAVAPPIYQTSTFQQDGVGKPRRGYEYARSQNPTRERLERAIADARGRPARVRVRLGLGRHGSHRRAGRAGRRGRRRGRRLRRHVPLSREGPQGRRGHDLVRRPRGGSGRALGGAVGTDPARLVRDADEPAAQDRRHRLGRGDRGATGHGGRPTAADRRRQHVRLAGHPAAADARCRHRLPLGHEVPGRPLRHDPGAGRRLGRGHRRAAALPAERDGCRARAAGLLPRAARPAHTAPARGAPRDERRGRVAAFLRERPDVAEVHYPGIGGMVSFLAAAERPSARPPSGRSRSPRGRASSRWPSRSAASSR